MPKTEPFDHYSQQYDAWFEQNPTLYQAELEAVRRLMPPPPARGLEIGVGSGKFAGPLGIKVGVEPSETMADRAKKQGIHVYRQVAEHLPFSDAEFDFGLMVTVICFVDDVLLAFKEAFRVLKLGGCLIVGFIDKASELGKQYKKKAKSSVFYREATFYSTREVIGYLVEAGFGPFIFKQTLIPEQPPDTIKDGFGRGAFVVIKAMKTRSS